MFNDINKNIANIKNRVIDFNKLMDKILEDISKIANSSSSIAAVSEETMANSEEAAAIAKEHSYQAEKSKELVLELLNTVKRFENKN